MMTDRLKAILEKPNGDEPKIMEEVYGKTRKLVMEGKIDRGAVSRILKKDFMVTRIKELTDTEAGEFWIAVNDHIKFMEAKNG